MEVSRAAIEMLLNAPICWDVMTRLILVKLQSQRETNVYKARDKITLHTLESVQSYL